MSGIRLILIISYAAEKALFFFQHFFTNFSQGHVFLSVSVLHSTEASGGFIHPNIAYTILHGP